MVVRYARALAALGTLAWLAACSSGGAGTYAETAPLPDAGAPTTTPDSGAPAAPDTGTPGLAEAGPVGSGDDGGSATAPPDVTPGVPITGSDGAWTDVPIPDGYCRDKSSAHLLAHLNSKSKKLAIYLEGGGACFNDSTCTFETFDFPTYTLGGGIFNFNRADNPIGDWNVFYIPYCTGDVHAGSNPAGVPGPMSGPQKYTGYSNMKLYLARILATVPDATDELLVGSSAGGFGAGLTADLVARNMPATVERFTLLDDSGQPMSSHYVAPCLQDQWRKVWGFDSTFLADCGGACPKKDDYVYDWIRFIVAKYANGTKGANASKFMGGLLSWTGDGIIGGFYGYGSNNCSGSNTALSAAVFEAGLLDFREMVTAQTGAFGTYFASGTSHTFLLSDSNGLTQGGNFIGGLYDTQVNGVKLVDWVANLLAHKAATQVGP